MQVYRTRSICLWVSVTMTSVCQWHNVKCVYVSVCVCVCVHSSCSLSSWVQGTCLAHITSIKVLSRSLPRKSLFTIPTLLKGLSGDAEVVGTASCCLASLHVLLAWWTSCQYFLWLHRSTAYSPSPQRGSVCPEWLTTAPSWEVQPGSGSCRHQEGPLEPWSWRWGLCDTWRSAVQHPECLRWSSEWCCCIVHDRRLDTLQSGYHPPWTTSSSLLLLWSKNCEPVSVWSARLSHHPRSLPHPHTPHAHPQNYPPHRRHSISPCLVHVGSRVPVALRLGILLIACVSLVNHWLKLLWRFDFVLFFPIPLEFGNHVLWTW